MDLWRRVKQFFCCLHCQQNCLDSGIERAVRSGDLRKLKNLVRRGADVNQLDANQNSLLTISITCEKPNVQIGAYLIKKGVDLDRRSANGKTAFFEACQKAKTDWIHMLMYYGADPKIRDDKNMFPISEYVAYWVMVKDGMKERLLKIIMSYTFEEGEIKDMDLKNLLLIMLGLNDDVPAILERCPKRLRFDVKDLDFLLTRCQYLQFSHLKLFIAKYKYIFVAMLRNFDVLKPLLQIMYDEKFLMDSSLRILNLIIFEFDLIEYLLEGYLRHSEDHEYCSVLMKYADYANNHHHPLENIAQIFLVLMSYGFSTLTTVDMDAVYLYWGVGEFFEIMIHLHRPQEVTWGSWSQHRRPMWAVLAYDLEADLAAILEHKDKDRYVQFGQCLYLFTLPQLKEVCADLVEKRRLHPRYKKRLENYPKVGSLKELSRDAARRFIIRKYDIKDMGYFISVLTWLNINKVIKQILMYRRIIHFTYT